MQEGTARQSKQDALSCIICLSGEDRMKWRIEYDPQSSGDEIVGQELYTYEDLSSPLSIFVKLSGRQCVPVFPAEEGGGSR